jgi:hypothetical protein
LVDVLAKISLGFRAGFGAGLFFRLGLFLNNESSLVLR